MSRQTLLRRGCFTCERAYAPDPRALAALYAARAEAMRFVPGGWRSCGMGNSVEVVEVVDPRGVDEGCTKS